LGCIASSSPDDTQSESDPAGRAHESSPCQIQPIGLLSALCSTELIGALSIEQTSGKSLQRRTTDGKENPRAEGADAKRPRTATAQRRSVGREQQHRGGWAADGDIKEVGQLSGDGTELDGGAKTPLGRRSQGLSPVASSPGRSSPWPPTSCYSCLFGSPPLADGHEEDGDKKNERDGQKRREPRAGPSREGIRFFRVMWSFHWFLFCRISV
jgi:hypothetical protein